MPAPSREYFRRTLVWVALVHLVAILFLGLWSLSRPKPPKPIEFINMLPVGNLVHGRPGPSEGPVVGKQFQPAAPAPPAPSTPAPTPPQPKAPEPPPAPEPEPVKAPEPTPEPTPAPKTPPDPSSWSQEKPKTKKSDKPDKPSTPKPEKTKPKIKIDLTEVDRPGTSSSHASTQIAKSHPSQVNGTEPGGTGTAREGVKGMTKEGIAERLGKELHASGVDKAVGIGPSGSPNGTGTGENSWYYSLIRDQMYQSWNLPIALAGKKLQTLIRIFVEKNGSISKVELVRSSGNKEHDDSALAAVHRVGRIREPLPDGMDGSIDINFRLTE